MSPSKREREYARRRFEKYAKAKSAQRARRRRNAVIAGGIVALLVLGLGVAAALASSPGGAQGKALAPRTSVTVVGHSPSDPDGLKAVADSEARNGTSKVPTAAGVIIQGVETT